jgi:hypothetical protein
MKKQIVFGLCLAAFLAMVPVIPTWAQTPEDLTSLLSGKATAMTLKDLNKEWGRIVVRRNDSPKTDDSMSQLMKLATLGSDDSGEAMGAMLGMSMMGGLFGGSGGATGETNTVYYTQGKTVTLGGETFLVTYQYQRKELNLIRMAIDSGKNGGKEPDFEKLAAESKVTSDTPLTLALLNVRSIGSITGIRPFDLTTEIAEAADSGNAALLELIAQSSKKGGTSPGGLDDLLDAETIATEVKTLLNSDPQLTAGSSTLNVTTKNNVIVLSGQVKTPRLQARAANLARELITGLELDMTVVNQIKVKP